MRNRPVFSLISSGKLVRTPTNATPGVSPSRGVRGRQHRAGQLGNDIVGAAVRRYLLYRVPNGRQWAVGSGRGFYPRSAREDAGRGLAGGRDNNNVQNADDCRRGPAAGPARPARQRRPRIGRGAARGPVGPRWPRAVWSRGEPPCGRSDRWDYDHAAPGGGGPAVWNALSPPGYEAIKWRCGAGAVRRTPSAASLRVLQRPVNVSMRVRPWPISWAIN